MEEGEGERGGIRGKGKEREEEGGKYFYILGHCTHYREILFMS